MNGKCTLDGIEWVGIRRLQYITAHLLVGWHFISAPDIYLFLLRTVTLMLVLV